MTQNFPPNPNNPYANLAVDQSILDSLTPEQWAIIQKYIFNRKGQKHPKLVDIRFTIDLAITRYYVVLLVGKDRRNRNRIHPVSGFTKAGNIVAAIFLLLSLNLILSASILLVLYLTKAALGIDLLPGHLTQTVQQWMK
jgi:hypothetical protein